MPQTEQSQYTIFCEKRFDKLDKKIDKIFTAIEGNGEGGLKGRVGKVESTVDNQESRWKWIFGILAAIVIAVILGHIRS